MMTKKLSQEQLFLGAVLLFAFVLRAFNYFDLSFMNDELSALARTKFSSFGELFSQGIIPDGHPPLVQLFLYFWTALFGYGETMVKLPFLIISIVSLYYLYLLTKELTQSINTALIVTLFFACNQLHLSYSTIARMYITGFFFAVALTYHWFLWLKNPNKKEYYLMILFAVLCAYNHHFSLLFALIVWGSGFLFITKEQSKKYLSALAIVLVAYLPIIYITFYQLFVTGGLNWMQETNSVFVEDFFNYFFHYNTLLILISLAGIVLLFLKNKNKYVLMGLMWFVIVMTLGFVYSLMIAPVIQFHLLLFVSPFLVIAIVHPFSYILDGKKYLILGGVICSLSLFSLIIGRGHFQLFPNQPYRTLAKNIKSIKQGMGKVLVVSDLTLKYLDFYLDEEYDYVDTISEINLKNYNYEDIINKYDYIITASSSESIEALFTPVFRPIKTNNLGQGCEIEVLKKRNKPEQKKTIIAQTNFVNPSAEWVLNPVNIQNKEGKSFYFKTNTEPWGPNYESAINKEMTGLLCVEVDYLGGDKDGEMGVAINVYDNDNKELKSNIAYSVLHSKLKGKQTAKVYLDLDALPENATKLKAFHWKISNETAEIYAMRISNVEKLLPRSFKNDSLVNFRDMSFEDQEPWSKIYQNPEIDIEYGENFMRLGKGAYWYPSTTVEYINHCTYGFEFEFKATELDPNTKIVVSAKANDKVIYYRDMPLSSFMKSQGKTWAKAAIAVPNSVLMNYSNQKVEIQMMMYKESGHEMLVKNPIIREYPSNKYIYSFFEKIIN
jgi:uncharacterized membrane protein